MYQNKFLSEDTLNKENDTLFDRFTVLVELHFKKVREVNFYARQLFVHPNYLNHVVRSFSKFTVKTFINNRVIQEAKYMLRATSMPIKEIAYDLGFSDYNYFSRLFKKTANCSPQQYRAGNI